MALSLRREHGDSARRTKLFVERAGVAEHAGRYSRFACALAKHGWAVLAHDHRGHGATARTPEDLGYCGDEDTWNIMLNDIDEVGRLARNRWPGLKLVRFGHSMGSTLTLHTLHKYPNSADGAILCGAIGVVGPLLAVPRLPIKIELLRSGKRGKSEMLDFLTFVNARRAFQPARTPFDWLSKDVEEVDKYINDPRCGFLMTNQHWYDHVVGLGEAYRQANIAAIPKSLPIRFIYGGSDPLHKSKVTGWSQLPAAITRMREAGLSQVSERAWPEGRHEILNDVERNDVTDDVVQWLNEHFARVA